MRKAVLGTVHPDMIDAHFCACLVPTITEDYDGHLVSRVPFLSARAPAGMLHVARNSVVKQFLQHPMVPDYLVFIDTDMAWVPSDVWRLLDEARNRDLPILGGLAAMQNGADLSSTKPVMFDYDFNTIEPTGSVQRVFCGGSAFLALRRDVMEACAAVHPWPTPWFDYGVRNDKAVTEEVIFAQRMWDLGVPVYVDSRIIVGHRKIHTFLSPALVGVH